MPEKDWRTDNWGGYHDYNRDPNYYRFPRTMKEAGWHGPYEHYNPKKGDSIRWWLLVFFIVLFFWLTNLGVISG